MANVFDQFTSLGGHFTVDPDDFKARVMRVRAYLFDWDGVFLPGRKGPAASNGFSEPDSMGVNLLRFGHWLRTGKIPPLGVISGENNPSAYHMATREHFNGVYVSMKHKRYALDHYCEVNGLQPEEVAFVFDDVVDLSIAEAVGLRIQVRNNATVLFNDYTLRNKLFEYRTFSDSDHHAVREFCELFLGVAGNFDEATDKRRTYVGTYEKYWNERDAIAHKKWAWDGKQIVELHSV